MKAFKPSKRALFILNAKQLFAFTLGTISYAIWPTSAEWAGLGLISILVAVASICLWGEATNEIFKFRDFEADQNEFLAQGKQVKSSTLASNDQLKKDGVIRDDQ